MQNSMQGLGVYSRTVLQLRYCRPIPQSAAIRRRRRRQNLIAGAANSTLVGIDLGTSNSAISIIKDGRAQILPDDQGISITPSLVTYTQVAAADRNLQPHPLCNGACMSDHECESWS